jgi:hypothetical protein
MYETLITTIRDKLDSVTNVKEIFAYPETKYTKYPAVVFYPSDLSNSFETTQENAKEYRFTMFVIVELKNLTKKKAFEEVLPRTVDAVVAAFDQGWDFGTFDGHRARALINTALWDTQVTEHGEIAFAQLNLAIKTLTSN